MIQLSSDLVTCPQLSHSMIYQNCSWIAVVVEQRFLEEPTTALLKSAYITSPVPLSHSLLHSLGGRLFGLCLEISKSLRISSGAPFNAPNFLKNDFCISASML